MAESDCDLSVCGDGRRLSADRRRGGKLGKREKANGKANRETGRRSGIRGRGARRRAATALFLCLLAVCAYTGCGSKSTFDSGAPEAADTYFAGESDGKGSMNYTTGGGVYEESDVEYPTSEAEPTDFGESQGADILEGRKLIRNVGLEVETKEFEQLMSSLETQVQEMGGYIESMETYNGSGYSDYVSTRYADLTLRVPGGKLNAFLQTVSDICNVVRRRDSVEDVTLSYVDMESRRNTLRTEQERLLSFLDQAETVEEIISIEARLSEVRYQLESMESQLRTIDNLVEYSTVQINIAEVRELTPVVEEKPSAWERIGEGFLRSLRNIGKGAVEFAVWFITNLPYLVIWAVVITGGVLIGRKMRKRALRKKEAKRQEQEAQAAAQRQRMWEWEAGHREANPMPPRQADDKGSTDGTGKK